MIEQLERIWRRVGRMLGAARITAVKDDGPVQILQVSTGNGGVQDDVPRLGEYGLASNPPLGSDVVLLLIGGSATDAAAAATGHQASRPRGLAAGEAMLHDNRGQRVYLSAAGIRVVGTNLPIEVTTTGSVTVNAETITLNATTLQVNANTTFNGTVTANGKRIDETHRHVPDSRGDTQGVVQ